MGRDWANASEDTSAGISRIVTGFFIDADRERKLGSRETGFRIRSSFVRPRAALGRALRPHAVAADRSGERQGPLDLSLALIRASSFATVPSVTGETIKQARSACRNQIGLAARARPMRRVPGCKVAVGGVWRTLAVMMAQHGGAFAVARPVLAGRVGAYGPLGLTLRHIGKTADWT
jgi:hypothetical protein